MINGPLKKPSKSAQALPVPILTFGIILFRGAAALELAESFKWGIFGEVDFRAAERIYRRLTASRNASLSSKGYYNLGLLYYHGYIGDPDHPDVHRAYRFFVKSAILAPNRAALTKLADMYRNGYYVEKDPQKYKEIIEELYRKIRRRKGDSGLVPEIYTRLAGIRTEEGKTDEALELYDQAREELTWRIMNNPFFGNLTIMKWLIADVYALRTFDPDDIDLYDFYYLFQKPCTVRFKLDGEQYEAECVIEDGVPVIRFGDRWFRNADDFFAQAEIDGELLTTWVYEFYDFEVEYGSDQR